MLAAHLQQLADEGFAAFIKVSRLGRLRQSAVDPWSAYGFLGRGSRPSATTTPEPIRAKRLVRGRYLKERT